MYSTKCVCSARLSCSPGADCARRVASYPALPPSIARERLHTLHHLLSRPVAIAGGGEQGATPTGDGDEGGAADAGGFWYGVAAGLAAAAVAGVALRRAL